MGSVERGVQLQAAQFQAPFSIMGQTDATALLVRLGQTKAIFYTAVEVNGATNVSGTVTAGKLRSHDTLEVGVYPPAGETVAVEGTIGATGNISTAAQVTAQTVLCNGDLTVVGTTRCDVLRGQAGTQVICQDAFSVDGALTVSGNVSSAGQVAAQTMFCNANLTVNGNIVGWSPFFCAGRVDGTTLAAVSSIGRVGYTVARASGQATGVYVVTFATPAPSSNYVITLTNMNFGTSYLWDTNPPTVNGFHCVVVSNTWSRRGAARRRGAASPRRLTRGWPGSSSPRAAGWWPQVEARGFRRRASRSSRRSPRSAAPP
jgi:hypothetical protein